MQLGALRDVLIEAGASTEKANQAAEEVAAYEREIAGIMSDLRVLKLGPGGYARGRVGGLGETVRILKTPSGGRSRR